MYFDGAAGISHVSMFFLSFFIREQHCLSSEREACRLLRILTGVVSTEHQPPLSCSPAVQLHTLLTLAKQYFPQWHRSLIAGDKLYNAGNY